MGIKAVKTFCRLSAECSELVTKLSLHYRLSARSHVKLIKVARTIADLKGDDNIFDINTLPGIFLQGFLAGIFGIIAGIFLLKLLGNQEIADIYQALHGKFWRAKPIQPSPDETTNA